MSAKQGQAARRAPSSAERPASEGGEKPQLPSVASYPRAREHVRRAKGWGGLGGFAIAAFLSLQASVPTEQVGLRALAAGVVGYLLAWGCAVAVWRQLIIAELRAVAERREAQEAEDDAAEPAAALREPLTEPEPWIRSTRSSPVRRRSRPSSGRPRWAGSPVSAGAPRRTAGGRTTPASTTTAIRTASSRTTPVADGDGPHIDVTA